MVRTETVGAVERERERERERELYFRGGKFGFVLQCVEYKDCADNGLGEEEQVHKVVLCKNTRKMKNKKDRVGEKLEEKS